MRKLLWVPVCLIMITFFEGQLCAQELISNVDSHDSVSPNDNDEVYLIGAEINITVTASGDRDDLTGTISIASATAGYSSGTRTLDNIGSGIYQYVWDTARLSSAKDYVVSVSLRDAEGNESADKSMVVELYTSDLLLKSVDSQDSANPDDDDEIYHAGQSIRIIVEYPAREQPVGTVVIDSETIGYRSAAYTLQKGPDNTLGSVWTTAGLREGSDYVVSVTLTDDAGHRVADSSLVINIDNTPPGILTVKSHDRDDTTDDDGIYHAGQTVVIDVQAADRVSRLESEIFIKSDAVRYDSGPQRLTDQGDGLWRYLWTTTGLNPAKDYVATVTFRDEAALESRDSSLRMEIDNTPPQNAKVLINNDDVYAITRRVELTLSADGATRMYVSGDVVDDVATFEWIPYVGTLGVNLTHGDEIKRVSVTFMDDASNQSPPAQDAIILDAQPPVITSVRSHDEADILDDDNVYHAGQPIVIVVETMEELVELEGLLSITSASVSYDSGSQKLDGPGIEGEYIYTWNTSGLLEASDYIVWVNLKDPSNREVSDTSLRITIDNTPPSGGEVKINDGQTETDSRSVTLTLSASGEPREVLIEGDLIDDTNTFEWIPYVSRVVVNLSDIDGEKEVIVRFRDAARNASGITTATILLDRQAPTSTSIIIEDEAKYTTTRDVSLKLQAVNAEQMLIDGDVVDDPVTFDWISYRSTVSLKLSAGDGEKHVGVVFRNKIGIQSDRIEDTIILDTSEPVVLSVDSSDSEDPEDNDEIYHPGQSIVIGVTTETGEHEVRPYIRIRSDQTAYDTGEQGMSGETSGTFFTYLWDTVALQESDDYIVFVELTDAAGHKTESADLKITIDGSPPMRGALEMNDGAETTDSRTVRLKVSATDAVSMFISGDVVDDGNTLEWVAYRTNITVNLSGEDGEKTIYVKFRDAASNESASVSKSITLDRESPYDLRMLIATTPEGAAAGESSIYTTSRGVFLGLEAKNAVEMYVSGDVVEAPDTFEWVPYSTQKEVNLTQGDGEKVIYAKFRNQRGIESEQIESRITLDTSPPEILSLTYQDAGDPEDDDGWYRPGESVRIIVEALEVSEPEAEITIKSESSGYDSGAQQPDTQTRTVGDTWRLEYVWNTADLDEGIDFTIEVTLTDAAGWVTIGDPKIIVIDGSPPASAKANINKGAKRTASRMVTLEASADDAVELFVAGDVRDDGDTFDWIPLKSLKSLNVERGTWNVSLVLTTGEGMKNVEVKFRDMAENETDPVTAAIILSQSSPVIEKVDSWDTSDLSDNDERYHAGELIKIALKVQSREDAPMIESGLLGTVFVLSLDAAYDSDVQKAQEESSGWYTYTWDTTGLAEGTYQATWNVSDGVGHEASDRSLSIVIDNTPPKDPQISINDGAEYTRSRSVTLNLQATDASWVFVDGEVLKEKRSTFEWIPFGQRAKSQEQRAREEESPMPYALSSMLLTVKLAGSDGVKLIQARFKDDADNTTEVIHSQIILDTVGPNVISVKINDGADYTSSTEVDLTVVAEDAVDMYIDGDVVALPLVRRWIPYQERVSLGLTEEDGEKTVNVELRDAVGNRSSKLSDTIILDSSPPEVDSVKSANSQDPADNDGRYLEGTQVNIMVDAGEAGLSATIQVSSQESGYISGIQDMEDAGDGIYTYLWDTSFLEAAEDYTASIVLEDRAGNSTVDDSLIMAIFDEPIEQKVIISDPQAEVPVPLTVTTSQSVLVSFSADNAAEMYIGGDVVDDSNTFEWKSISQLVGESISNGPIDQWTNRLMINLTPGDGVKNITVTFRDSLSREIGTLEAAITLDQTPPVIADVRTSQKTYRAGGTAEIVIRAGKQEPGLEGIIRVRSVSTGYDSGSQKATEGPAGEYTYLWDTTGLKEGQDYRVEATLSDEGGWTAKDYRLAIAIDNTPPEGGDITVNDGSLYTRKRSVKVAFVPPEESVEIFIEGDLVRDSNTFQWVPVSMLDRKGASSTRSLVVNLNSGDGKKRVRVKFRDEAGNETSAMEKIVVLNELPPIITAVDSWDEGNPGDDDEIYHAGQMVKINVTFDDREIVTAVDAVDTEISKSRLEAWVQITSEEAGYDSDLLTATREDTDSFAVTWNTLSIPEASDYKVKAILQDEYGQKTVHDSLIITIDNTPPVVLSVSIQGGKSISNVRSVVLVLTAEDAAEMFIEGDVAEGRADTFQWIPLVDSKEIQLSEGDGAKNVTVKVRDSAGNVSEPASATIVLDRSIPSLLSISINGDAEYTESHQIILQLSAKSAREMYISGDIVQSESTFRWILYGKEFSARLSEGEGEKTVRALFRNGVGNESDEVEAQIVLDFSPPMIASIQAFDMSDETDDDLNFHSGQGIVLRAEAEEDEAGLEGFINIRSTGDQYILERQSMTDAGGGRYTVLWDTEGIADGNYSCEITLEDIAGHSATDIVEIVIDNQGPRNPSITIKPVTNNESRVTGEELVTQFAWSRTIEVSLSADGDPAEVFIAGDVVDDDRTFEWIPFELRAESEEQRAGSSMLLTLNLRGSDGEKDVTAIFRDKARSESSEAIASIPLELKRPELVESCRIIETDIAIAEPRAKAAAYLALQFDEPISKIEPKDFFLALRDKASPQNVVHIDGTSVEPILSDDIVMVEISADHLHEIRQWQPMTLASSYIQAEIAENSAFDIADKGNLSNERSPADVYFVAPALSIQVDVQPTSFSPNNDEIRDEIVIAYSPARISDIAIKIRDPQREIIKEWDVENQTGGLVYSVEWNGKKPDASPYPDGKYTVIIMGSEVQAAGFAYGMKSNFTIDNSAPQIVDIRPWEGAEIPVLFRASINVVDTPKTSGIESVYITIDGDIENEFPLARSEIEGEYVIPTTSELLLPPGKHDVSFHVVDMAGNETEKTVSYIVVAEIEPLLSVMNFPNPFPLGGTTRIRYSLPEEARRGEVAIYDAGGDMVFFKDLRLEELERGEHTFQWDGVDMFGYLLARGTYFCRLWVTAETEDKSKTHKIAIR